LFPPAAPIMEDLCTFLGNCRCPKCLEENPEIMEDDPGRYERLRAQRVSAQKELLKMKEKMAKMKIAQDAENEEKKKKKLMEEMLAQEKEEEALKFEEQKMLAEEDAYKQRQEKKRIAAQALKDRFDAEKKAKEDAIRKAEEDRLEAIRQEEEKRLAEIEAQRKALAEEERLHSTVDLEMSRVKDEILKKERDEEALKAKEIEARKQILVTARKAKENARLSQEAALRQKVEALMAQEAMIRAMEAEQKRLKDEQARREEEARIHAEEDAKARAEAQARMSQAQARMSVVSNVSEGAPAKPRQAATFILPRSMGVFEFNKPGRKFRGVRKLKRMEKQEDNTIDYRDVALVTCNDIMFLCAPSQNGPFVLIHLPSPRAEVQATEETDPTFPPLTLRITFSGVQHYLLTSSQAELDFWMKTVNNPEA